MADIESKVTQLADVRLVLCNDTAANWKNSSKILMKGEIGIELTDNGPKFKVGDGVTGYAGLAYATLTPAEISAIAEAAAKDASTHANKEVLDAIEVALTSAMKKQYDKAYAYSQEDHAPVNAQENVIESVKVNGKAQTVTAKGVDITVNGEGATSVSTDEVTGAITISSTDTKYDDSTLKASVQANADAIDTLNGQGEGSVTKAVKDASDAIDAKIGTVSSLDTEAKVLVDAINEVNAAVGKANEAGAVTVDTSVTSDGASKSYKFSQNGKVITTVDIPKDMVISSGTVETYTTDNLPTDANAPKVAGTYIVLTVANAAADKLYIDAKKLVDIYTGKETSQITVTVDGYEISADIKAGAVSTTELADAAVTTAKVADKNITKAKLADDVVASLGAADGAIQTVSGVETTKNGTDVKVTGIDVSLLTNAGTLILNGGSSL